MVKQFISIEYWNIYFDRIPSKFIWIIHQWYFEGIYLYYKKLKSYIYQFFYFSLFYIILLTDIILNNSFDLHSTLNIWKIYHKSFLFNRFVQTPPSPPSPPSPNTLLYPPKSVKCGIYIFCHKLRSTVKIFLTTKNFATL